MNLGMGGLEQLDKRILLILSQLDVSVSKRELAELSSLDENTVHTSIQRLKSFELIFNSNRSNLHPHTIQISPFGEIIAKRLEFINDQEYAITGILSSRNDFLLKKYY